MVAIGRPCANNPSPLEARRARLLSPRAGLNQVPLIQHASIIISNSLEVVDDIIALLEERECELGQLRDELREARDSEVYGRDYTIGQLQAELHDAHEDLHAPSPTASAIEPAAKDPLKYCFGTL